MTPQLDKDIARLALELSSASSVAASISIITTFAAQSLQTSHAGATLIRKGGRSFETAGATDDVVQRADQLQNDLQEGPCVDAAVESRSVRSNDLSHDERWPRWGRAIATLGLGSILSSEMHANGQRIGALNVYGETGREFTREEAELAQLLAQHAAAALHATGTIEGLVTALDSRTLIGQAQGILMERYAVDADRAFAILRRYSQTQNVRLTDVARLVVNRGELVQPQP